MKKLSFILSFFLTTLIVSCGPGDDDPKFQGCVYDTECQQGFYCDEAGGCKKIEDDSTGIIGEESSNEGETDDSGAMPESDDSGQTQNPDKDESQPDKDLPEPECNPGDEERVADAFTENKGECKTGIRMCLSNGFWGELKAMWIEFEPCTPNGKDEDCDGTIDNVDRDWDGDEFGRCKDGAIYDCYEVDTEKIIDPKLVNPGATELIGNNIDDNCDNKTDQAETSCDGGLNPDNPEDYAKAMGLCKGVKSASFYLADAQGTPAKTYAIRPGFGSVVTKREGMSLAIMSTGTVDSPMSMGGDQGTSSKVYQEWINAQPDQKFPVAESCPASTSSTGANPTVKDPVMIELVIDVPSNANSFSFNSYFFSKEYPVYICSTYNDFFLALLDSDFNMENPTLPEDQKNPADMNLAMDANGNPVGVNLAPAGLFKQCENKTGVGWAVTSCEGTAELEGTGFTGNGGTGWLVTNGNVIPGEEITLRLVIWDTGDAQYDSTILLDNFQWHGKIKNPGTGGSK